MPRIKIEDLPVLEELSAKQSQGIFGAREIVGDSGDELGIIQYGSDNGSLSINGNSCHEYTSDADSLTTLRSTDLYLNERG